MVNSMKPWLQTGASILAVLSLVVVFVWGAFSGWQIEEMVTTLFNVLVGSVVGYLFGKRTSEDAAHKDDGKGA